MSDAGTNISCLGGPVQEENLPSHALLWSIAEEVVAPCDEDRLPCVARMERAMKWSFEMTLQRLLELSASVQQTLVFEDCAALL